MTNIRVIQERSAFLKLRKTWEDLYWKNEEPSPFMSWEWVSSWIEIYDQPINFFAIVVEVDAHVRGILPLRKSMKQLLGVSRVPVLEMLQSCARTCPDHLGILCDPQELKEMTGLIFDFLKGSAEWQLLDLKEWGQPSALTGIAYGKIWNLRLPETFEQFVTTLRSEKRSKLKRLRKRYEKEGNLSLQVVEGGQEMLQQMDAFVALHASRWGDANPSTFGEAFSRKVHKAFIEKAAKSSPVIACRMVLLKNSDGLVAGVYGMQIKKVFYYYQMARKIDPQFSGAGQLIMGHAIETALKNGSRRFDFLRGDEPFKAEWTADFYFEQRILLAQNSVVAKTYVLLQNVKANIRRRLQ